MHGADALTLLAADVQCSLDRKPSDPVGPRENLGTTLQLQLEPVGSLLPKLLSQTHIAGEVPELVALLRPATRHMHAVVLWRAFGWIGPETEGGDSLDVRDLIA